MRVKICGMCSVQDVQIAVDAGADALGFVFAMSPRQVTLDQVRAMLAVVPAGVLRVGVLRGPDSGPLSAMFELGLDAIQIERDGRAVPPFPAGIELWSVLKDSDDLAERAAALSSSATILIDSAVGGGSGQRADAGRVAALAQRRPVMLAGGLTPENVADAIVRIAPCGVDVSSGVESAPGVKDPERVRAFVRAAREAVRQLPEGVIPRCP